MCHEESLAGNSLRILWRAYGGCEYCDWVSEEVWWEVTQVRRDVAQGVDAGPLLRESRDNEALCKDPVGCDG